MQRFAQFIVRYRVATLVVAAAITALLGFCITRLRINADFMSYLPKDDEQVRLFQELDSLYATGNIVGIGIQAPGESIMTVEGLGLVQRITDSLAAMEGVEKVTSLTNVLDIRHTDEGAEIGRLVDDDTLAELAEASAAGRDSTGLRVSPALEARLDSLGRYTLAKAMYRGQLLADGGRSTAIMLFIGTGVDEDPITSATRALLAELGRHYPGYRFYYGGMPMQQLYLTEAVRTDLTRLVPIVCLVIGVVLAFTLRTVRGVLLPLLGVAVASVWTLGAMALCGVALSPVSGSIPVVLFAVGSAYTIHVLNFLRMAETAGGTPGGEGQNFAGHRGTVARGLATVGVPVMLAGITTIVGFLSFIPGTYLSIIRDFGAFMALGTAFCLLISLTVIPAIESFLPALKPPRAICSENPTQPTVGASVVSSDVACRVADNKNRIADNKNRVADSNSHVADHNPSTTQSTAPLGRVSRFLLWLSGLSVRHAGRVVWISLAVLVLLGAGIFLIKSNIDVLYYFGPRHPLRVSAEFMNREFGGTLPIQVKVEGDLTDPTTLRAMEEFEEYLDGLPGVSNPKSVVMLMRELNEAMGEGNRIPNTQEKVQNLWFLLEGEPMMEQLCTPDRMQGQILATMQNANTKTYHQISRAVDQYAKAHSSATVRFEATGSPFIYSNFAHNLMWNLVLSLVLACALVYICMALLLQSFKGALVGFIPLLCTIVCIFGLMGYLGFTLNLATVLIAGVAVGVGVDYAIHFVTGYRRALAAGSYPRQAVVDTLLSSGRGILFNILAVAIGFLVLVFAVIIPLVEFGVVMAATMLIAGLAATVLLPAEILRFRIRLHPKR
ncbi:MAG: hypothetical protein AL399_00705 [Candidatus [Bacteroides] periocalifornicus]|uniref:SSD domain-containing protein n=1 Tax=Candidatus [Bacteroides] periocalifornicus TaxID=1702214 RepID=A0A0Q4B957_9BACT|nr:MAG: hypothetical protein AL399_00705 [Candidatus [Bacteroides] periocalifornicus]